MHKEKQEEVARSFEAVLWVLFIVHKPWDVLQVIRNYPKCTIPVRTLFLAHLTHHLIKLVLTKNQLGPQYLAHCLITHELMWQ